MKQTLTYIALAIAVVMAIAEMRKREQLESEISRLSVELAHARIPMEPTVIHDSIPVVTQTVVEVPRKDLVDALAAERRLVKDLQLRISQLEAVQTTVLQVGDTVPAQYRPHDSIFTYHDQWADLSLQLKDTTFYYNIRDSLSTIVYREYRHHFLWWKWGTRGYRLKIVNFNPHSRIIYNMYIKAASK